MIAFPSGTAYHHSRKVNRDADAAVPSPISLLRVFDYDIVRNSARETLYQPRGTDSFRGDDAAGFPSRQSVNAPGAWYNTKSRAQCGRDVRRAVTLERVPRGVLDASDGILDLAFESPATVPMVSLTEP